MKGNYFIGQKKKEIKMSKVYEYLKQFEREGPEHPDEMKARKAIKKAAKKRNSRKTPYPFGFEYKRKTND